MVAHRRNRVGPARAIPDARVGEQITPLPRVGLGHDTHRLVEGGPLRLGGVEIPHSRRADAHSDGDVLLHALIDALLGATAQGDIGEWFPDTAAENRDRDSAEMVRSVMESVRQAGLQAANVDGTIFAQRPKLSAHKDVIRRRIAELLKIDVDRVSVKAKTGEGVGPIGREEAIAAQCVVMLTEA